jgi:hypothetical protein
LGLLYYLLRVNKLMQHSSMFLKATCMHFYERGWLDLRDVTVWYGAVAVSMAELAELARLMR